MSSAIDTKLKRGQRESKQMFEIPSNYLRSFFCQRINQTEEFRTSVTQINSDREFHIQRKYYCFSWLFLIVDYGLV